MEARWDVIVVGARCAGATLAALVARQGKKTLLLEAGVRGTDQPLSTHLVQAAGMDVLDLIGVGNKVRAVAPPVRALRYALDEAVTLSRLAEGRYSYCVRRSVVDPWLQEAAEEAGATFLDRHRVVDLVKDGDRVTGVVARGPQGLVTFHADLVVGADGMHSTVAKLAGAEEYYVSEGNRAGYWGYFPAPKEWTNDWDATLEHKGEDIRYVFRSDADTVTVVYAGPAEPVRAWGREHKQRLMAVLAGSESTRPLTEGKEPVDTIRGLLKTRFFYRRAAGPGFALAGDAGHFKDFVTGLGMSDAFLDAQRLARAVLDGRQEAFELYWRERDAETLPLHYDAIGQGAVGYNEPFIRWVISRMGSRADLRERVALMLDRKIGPDELVPMRVMLGWMAEALVKGRFDVLKGFLKTGKELGEQAKQIKERRALFARARAAYDALPPTASRAQAPRATVATSAAALVGG